MQVYRRMSCLTALALKYCLLALLLGCASTVSGASESRGIADTHLLKTASTGPKSTCANSPTEAKILCVYLDWSDAATRIDLFQIVSADGGTTWSAPVAITKNPGDEYDPFINYDAVHKKFWLIYAKWHNDRGGQHNDVVARSKDCVDCTWSEAVVVAGDGVNDYWVPSILALQNGNVLALYTKNGPESSFGVGSGTIEVKRSADAGASWSAPSIPTKDCDVEYARAVQNAGGSVLLVFGRYVDSSHLPKGTRCADGMSGKYPYTDIHQAWSPDGGVTWKGESVLYHGASGSALHPFVAAEQATPQERCSKCRWDLFFVQSASGSFAVFRMQSSDQGISWSQPTRFSDVGWPSPFNIDPGFVYGCKGLVANYTSGYGSDKVYVQVDAAATGTPTGSCKPSGTK